jgi:hypothetical protein
MAVGEECLEIGLHTLPGHDEITHVLPCQGVKTVSVSHERDCQVAASVVPPATW